MQTVAITITNVWGDRGEVISIGNLGMSIEEQFKFCCSIHPDCFVNVYWNNGKDFICGMPLNMKRDEELVDTGHMTFDDYIAKWYPEVASGPALNF